MLLFAALLFDIANANASALVAQAVPLNDTGHTLSLLAVATLALIRIKLKSQDSEL